MTLIFVLSISEWSIWIWGGMDAIAQQQGELFPEAYLAKIRAMYKKMKYIYETKTKE